MVVRDRVDGAHEHASAEVSIEIDRSSSFWSKVSPGSNKLTSDPRVVPASAEAHERWGRHMAAIREACGGWVSSLTVDWTLGVVLVECHVPSHVQPTAFGDALGWRLAIIERRMGLREKDEAADADAVERLAKLLPPPPATES
jgi:hypothetical protein